MGASERAVILAGGQGTRLRPLTLHRAKPVVPLLNHPMLAYQLALLGQHGIARAVLSCGYRVDDVQAAMQDVRGGARLEFAVEAEPLGTGGGLRHAAGPAAGPVWALNGDILADPDLDGMRDFHRTRGAGVTILLTRVADPSQYGLVETEGDGRILAFREKPAPGTPCTTDTVNAGVYLIEGELLARMPAGRAVSIEREFFPELIADGVPCFGWVADRAYWRDIGTPAAYLAANADLLARRVRTPLDPAGQPERGVWVGPGVRGADAAELAAPSVVGTGAELGRRSSVGPGAVLGPRARLGERARVAASVLWEDVDIGADAVVEGAVLGAGVRVGAGAVLGAGTVVPSGAAVAAGVRVEDGPSMLD